VVTHVAYTDESSYNFGRYRSLAMISMPVGVAGGLSINLADILSQSGIREAKWNRVKTARDGFASQKLLRCFLDHAAGGSLRGDALIWDTWDRRHAVVSRDDMANLGRMYYHLCRIVLRDRWPRGSVWMIYPDEQRAMSWTTLEETLGLAGFKQGLSGGSLRLARQHGYQVLGIKPVRSHEEPIVQLADLLAGMAAYSWTSFDAWETWQDEVGPQASLFPRVDRAQLSNADRERCVLLHELDGFCKARKWGVALKSTRGLQTHDPTRAPLNFWKYVSQSEQDRAPTRLDDAQ